MSAGVLRTKPIPNLCVSVLHILTLWQNRDTHKAIRLLPMTVSEPTVCCTHEDVCTCVMRGLAYIPPQRRGYHVRLRRQHSSAWIGHTAVQRKSSDRIRSEHESNQDQRGHRRHRFFTVC